MRFKKLELYENNVTGTDVLGNEITVPVLIGAYQGLVTSWTAEEIALLDREVTRTQRKLMTDAPISEIKKAEKIRIDDKDYSFVMMKTDSVRWRVCQVKDYFQ